MAFTHFARRPVIRSAAPSCSSQRSQRIWRTQRRCELAPRRAAYCALRARLRTSAHPCIMHSAPSKSSVVSVSKTPSRSPRAGRRLEKRESASLHGGGGRGEAADGGGRRRPRRLGLI